MNYLTWDNTQFEHKWKTCGTTRVVIWETIEVFYLDFQNFSSPASIEENSQ